MADSPALALAATGKFEHVAFFYRSVDEYARTVAGFVRDGLAVGEPVFAAAPPGRVDILRDALGADARHVEFADMTRIGLNPAWIIPRVHAFMSRHPGRRVRYAGEPVWASRTAAQLREATTHESLINLAFATADAGILCPYDVAELDPVVIADARRTHPSLLSDGRRGTSPGYTAQFQIPSNASAPLPAPAEDSVSHTYHANLSEVRALVHKQAVNAGLPESRANDLVLAVSEVAGNTLRHTRSDGILTIWRDGAEIICEVRDEGIITDPLVGRRAPALSASGGHGLWLVHQVCDLVELRSDPDGTTVRMHMAIPALTPRRTAASTVVFMW